MLEVAPQRDGMTEKTLFITDGASGLGLELVRAAVARGHRICCAGRRSEDDLRSELSDIPYLQCDMTTIEDQAGAF